MNERTTGINSVSPAQGDVQLRCWGRDQRRIQHPSTCWKLGCEWAPAPTLVVYSILYRDQSWEVTVQQGEPWLESEKAGRRKEGSRREEDKKKEISKRGVCRSVSLCVSQSQLTAHSSQLCVHKSCTNCRSCTNAKAAHKLQRSRSRTQTEKLNKLRSCTN